MSLTRAAIEKNRVTVVALLLIVVSGVMAYLSMPRDEDPGFIVRTATVTTYFPGASPQRVEMLVTDKLEKVIQQIPEIDYLNSESKAGVSVVYVNILESYSNMRPIWDDLRRKVESAVTDLPQEVIGPFVNDEFGDVFGVIVTITGDGFNYAELKEIADDCRDELLLIREIAKVDIYGQQEERVFVEYNNARLAELGLSPAQLQSILQDRNIIIPGGEIFTPDEQIILEPTGNFDSVEDLRRTVIRLPDSQDVLYLEDLARIERGYIDPPTSRTRYKGTPALALAVNMREGGNILTLGQKVMAQIERFRIAYPLGVNFDVVAFQPQHVERKIQEFVGSVYQAIAIVLLVMLIFLGIRTGLVVATLIPMAMIMALWVMSIFGIGLDQMSLASLIIALGMLVDNAIVMSESVMVQMASGVAPVDAAVRSADELRIPLLTSSLTTAAAFLPIYLAESGVGEYCAPIFVVVTITLLCSWLLALTMTPLLCVKFLRVKTTEKEQSFGSPLYRTYRLLLIGVLKRPLISLLLVAAVFALSLFGFRFIPKIFFPPNDKAIFSAELRMPIGTPLEKTEAVVGRVEQFVAQNLLARDGEEEQGVMDWVSFVGRGAPRYVLTYSPEPPSPEYAYLLFNATSIEAVTDELMPKLEAFLEQSFPALTAKVELLQLGTPVDNPVEIRISGKDTSTLFQLVDQVKARLSTVPGISTITDDWGQRTKKLVVQVNQPRALRAGLTSRDVAVSLQTVLSGIETTDYREQDEIIPVVLRSVAADRHDIGKLETHNIYVQATGKSVPLKQVADINVAWEPAKVLRRDRLRTVTLEAGVLPGFNAIAIAQQMGQWLDGEKDSWPIGFKYELGGELEKSGEANASIQVKLPIAGLIIILLLVGQFNSIRRPLIICLTIPLGVIGVVIGLLVAKSYFGFMTLLGVISLAGIVINNAIVLLDRIKIEIEDNGLEPSRAIVEAAQRRLRPILLTTATTVGGLLPLWFGGGPMWEPMAIAIIFGLLFATLLTLGVVPLLYALLFRVRFRQFRY